MCHWTKGKEVPLLAAVRRSHSSPPALIRTTPRVPIAEIPSNNSYNGRDGTVGMSSLLGEHYLGTFKMRLGNIKCTEMVRPINMTGVKRIVRSIRVVGWLEQFPPSAVIQRDRLGGGDQLTAKVALGVVGRTLDGNHRIAALKEVCNDETVIPVRVYLEFNQAEERLIANALNDATESVVERTLFDKVYFQHQLEEAMKREMKKNKISLGDIRRMYDKVGVTAPPKTTLRNWQLCVDALHPESFDKLKEVCESSEPGVDGNAVTLTYLTRKDFKGFSPLKQGLCIRLLSRFKHLNKKSPTSKDYDAIDKDAQVSETFIKSVIQVVPWEEWTPELTRAVNRLSYEKPEQVDVFLKPHARERKNEVTKLLDKVSAGDQTSSHVVQLKESISTVVACKPQPRIRGILSKDATLRPYLLSWDARYQDVLNQVNFHKFHCGTGGYRGASSSNEPGKGSCGDRGDGHGGWNKGVCCPRCIPPPTARYSCIKCSITHMAQCDNAKIVTQELSKNRLCIDCPRSLNGSEGTGGVGDDAASRGKGKAKEVHKRRSASVGRSHSRPNLSRASSGGEAADMEKCMAENTALHDIHPLDPTRREFDDFAFRKAPKLVILSIAAEPKLLMDTEVANDHLKTIVSLMCSKMHPKGTMALVVPHPWSEYFTRLQVAVRDVRMGLVAEDHPLILVYKKMRRGVPPAAGTENHLKGNVDMILLAHTDRTAFTCNKIVTVDDTFGQGTDARPLALQAMCNLEYEGAGTDIPMRTLHFLINRFTNAGDTVVSFSAERHNVVEGALELSRRVEVFVSNAQSKDEVRDSMKISFTRAYKDGKWKVSTSLVEERVIGPSCLPIALGPTLVPIQAQRMFAEVTSPEGKAMGRDEATLHVATEMAKAFGYDLESPKESSSSVPTEAMIFPLPGKEYHVNTNDLPAWGNLEVFNSRVDALRSLSVEEQDDQCIRLLHVANNVQLKRMLFPEKEVCRPGAELYLRVAATCPLYYMRWTEDAEQANIKFTSNVPQSGSRADILRPFSRDDAGVAFVTPVIGRVFQHRARNGPRSPFCVLPGLIVVRPRGFEVRDTDSDSSPTQVTDQKRKRPYSRLGEKGKGRRKARRGAGGASPYESDEEEEEGGWNVYEEGEGRGGDMVEGTSGGRRRV